MWPNLISRILLVAVNLACEQLWLEYEPQFQAATSPQSEVGHLQ